VIILSLGWFSNSNSKGALEGKGIFSAFEGRIAKKQDIARLKIAKNRGRLWLVNNILLVIVINNAN
jgi:hypothetical protein